MLPPLFHIGDNPLVSVLIPTRKRVVPLFNCISSIYNKAVFKSRVEVVLKVDEDDLNTINHLPILKKEFPDIHLTFIISPRGSGYADLHKYYNEMASKARGDWLFVFNDDVQIVSPEWDIALATLMPIHPWVGIDEICYVNVVDDIGGSPFDEFFLVRRKMFEITGHLGEVAFVNHWFPLICGPLGCKVSADLIRVKHNIPHDEIPRNNLINLSILSQTVTYRRARMYDAALLNNRLEELLDKRIQDGPPKINTWSLWINDEGFSYLYSVFNNGKISRLTVDGLRTPSFNLPTGGKWATITRWVTILDAPDWPTLTP